MRFPRQVIGLFTDAIPGRNRYLRGELPLGALQDLRDDLDLRLWEPVRRPRAVPAQARLADHLWRHLEPWFVFLSDPAVEATNWRAEQALRPAVVNRKVWGGNRTAAGAAAQAVLMSVLATCRRQARSALDHVSHTPRSVGNLLLPRPALLPTR